MRLAAGGFLIAVSDLETSVPFYCQLLDLRVLAEDGTSVMLGSQPAGSWLLALRAISSRAPATHPTGALVGIRALFFRVGWDELDIVEQRLRGLGGFHERHEGEFYDMVSAYSPDRNALGFWAPRPGSAGEGPSFVPPSIYYLD